MNVIKAKTSGFCMGVKRAMQLALETAKETKGQVFTLGSLIHNPQAIEHLKDNGVETLPSDVKVDFGTIIIRAHGIPLNELNDLKKKNIKIVDATCPHVLTSQKQIKKFSDEGWHIVIVGDPNHPEIKSLQSYAKSCTILKDINEANSFICSNKIMVISQTTYNSENYKSIAELLKTKSKEIHVCNSICMATNERQKEIRELAKNADAVVIVGGMESANTRRLAQIASEYCNNVQHVETVDSLNTKQLNKCKCVVVSAGASTPDFITDKIIEYLKSID